MAPSLINTVGVVAAAFVAGASATKSYKVAEKYNSANFYDKWAFVTVRSTMLHTLGLCVD